MPRVLRGRDTELEQLRALVDGVMAGGGGVVLIEGMPGIGKSALIDELAGVSRTVGCAVAAGCADELDRMAPMGPLLSGLRTGDRPLLTQRDLDAMDAGDQRIVILDRLCQLLEAEAGRHPLVIILDDLQWADQGTILAVASLPLRLVSSPILWVLARRSGIGSVSLDTAWRRLAEAGADRLHVGPVDPSAVVAITVDVVGAPPGSSLMREVTRAGGNPFYLTQLLYRLVDVGALDVHGGSAHLRAGQAELELTSVASHLNSLSEAARRLVQIGAIFGQRFSLDMVADMLGVPAGSLVDAVAECHASRMLADDGDVLMFQHDLLRQAAYTDLPKAVRVALHRDAARLLSVANASPVEVASHLALGARIGDTAAIEGLGAAAATLITTNPSGGADLLVRALDLLPPDDSRRAEFSARAVDALGWAGRLAEAEAIRDQMAPDIQLDPVQEAIIELGIRRSWAQRASRPYARPLPPGLVDEPSVPAGLRIGLLAMDAVTSIFDDLAGTVAKMDALLAEANVSGDDAAVAAVRIGRLSAVMLQGHLEAVFEEFRAAAAWADAGGAFNVRNQAFHDGVARALYALDRLDDAFEAFQIACREARRSGSTYLIAITEVARAAALLSAGRLDDAAAAAESAQQMCEDFGFGRYLAESLRILGEVALARGDLAGASICATRVRDLLTAGYASPSAWWLPAVVADAQCDPHLALALLDTSIDRLAGGDYRLVLPESERLPLLVAMCMRADRPGLADVVTSQAVALAERNPHTPLLDGVALHCQALLHQEEPLLAKAVACLRGCHRPLALAAAQEDLGDLRRVAGDPSGSAEALSDAYDIAVRCDAQHTAARLRRALRRVGVVKRATAIARPTVGWASLTDAELAVVKLVASGHTSRAAAQRLFVSTNTVNTHLHHIFTKLGLRSRVELVRAALDQDAVQLV